MKSHIASLLLLCAGCALPANAWAELRFCNRTGSNISVAIAWVQKEFRSASDGCPTGTVSRGFHRIDSDARTFTMTLR